MKPTLTVLLGAGSSLNLGVTPPDVTPIGMPSTDDLTKRIKGMPFPAVLHRRPIFLGPDESQPLQYNNKQIPILPMIYHALTSEFDYVDFELILHAVEQLEPIVASIEDRRRVDRYRAVLSAFVEVNRKLDLLSDAVLLLAIRPLIITEIYRIMTSIPVEHLAQPPALHRFIRNLEDEFQLGVFTLNYDDVVDGARDSWFDGFTRPVDHSQGGRVWSANGFDARHFNKWREPATTTQARRGSLAGLKQHGPSTMLVLDTLKNSDRGKLRALPPNRFTGKWPVIGEPTTAEVLREQTVLS